MELQELTQKAEFARIYAGIAHDDETPNRKGTNAPYHVHPETVQDLLEGYGASEDELIAAALHDTLEDTSLTYDTLEDTFGEDVANLVSELTNAEDLDGMSKESYMNKKLVNLSDSALTVKLGDMTCNVLDAPRIPQIHRMWHNIQYLIDNRDNLLPIHKELIRAFRTGMKSKLRTG